jgi:hypothetical protein
MHANIAALAAADERIWRRFIMASSLPIGNLKSFSCPGVQAFGHAR